jgi:hypothetical protein
VSSSGNAVTPAAAQCYARRGGGFTFIEAVVVLTVLTILVGLTVAAVGRARQGAHTVTCSGNLRAIGQGFAFYANANGGVLPYVAESSPQWEDLLITHGLQRKNFCCPADQEVYPALGSSYDWRDTGKADPDPALDHPNTFSGRRLFAVRQDLVMAFESFSDWHKRGYYMVVYPDMRVSMIEEHEYVTDRACPAIR